MCIQLYDEHVDGGSLQYCTWNVVYKVFIIYSIQLIISNRDDVGRVMCMCLVELKREPFLGDESIELCKIGAALMEFSPKLGVIRMGWKIITFTRIVFMLDIHKECFISTVL